MRWNEDDVDLLEEEEDSVLEDEVLCREDRRLGNADARQEPTLEPEG
jgi:hypothetical protein